MTKDTIDLKTDLTDWAGKATKIRSASKSRLGEQVAKTLQGNLKPGRQKGLKSPLLILKTFASLLVSIESDIEFSRRVMMIKESLPHHGGSGAYYIFLRRQSK